MTSISSVGLSSAIGLTILKAAMAQPATPAQLVASAGSASPALVASSADQGAMLAQALATLTSRDAASALRALEANAPAVPQLSPG